MRRLSPYVTRVLIATSLTPNGVTWLMIASGLLAAVSLTFPGVLGALGAFVLIQAQLLFDCCDGEVARWWRRFSPRGVYLDGIGHYSTEAALAAALGIRADGGWGSIGGWTTLGLLVAVLVLFLKSESHLVEVARAHSGRPPHEASAQSSAPLPGVLRRIRRAARPCRRSRRRRRGRSLRDPCPAARARPARAGHRRRPPGRHPRLEAPRRPVIPRYGCVVLTQGHRPHELRLALESLLSQRGVGVDIVVVGNGWAPTGLPEGVRGLALPENVGATAGRNAGSPSSSTTTRASPTTTRSSASRAPLR
jgi:hypothetical protein